MQKTEHEQQVGGLFVTYNLFHNLLVAEWP